MRGIGFMTAGVLAGVAAALLWSRAPWRAAPNAATSGRGGDTSALTPSAAPPWSPAGVQARARELAGEIARQQVPRVGITEAELTAPGAPLGPQASPSAGLPTPAAAPSTKHTYQADAATFTRLLREHKAEPTVAWWARERTTVLERMFVSTEQAPPHVEVDCRSKTCVARLRFASPEARTVYLQGTDLPLPAPCHAVTLSPRELSAGAPYEASVIYLCRP